MIRAGDLIPADVKFCAACRQIVARTEPIQADANRYCKRCTGEVGGYRVKHSLRMYCPDPACLAAALAANPDTTLLPVTYEQVEEADRCASCEIRLLDA